MFLEKLSALFTDAVEYCSQRIQFKAVFLEEVAADLVQLLTMKVKELAALLALQVEA